MSIVSHTVTTTKQSSTRKNAVYTFTDHIGGLTHVNKLVANNFNTETDALSMYARIVEGLVDSEESEIEAKVEAGEDVSALVLATNHTTAKNIVKKLIRYMMRTRDPYLVIALEPLIIYLRANYTGAQLISFLDITAGQATKMNQRINAILDNKSVFTDYDAGAEDIE
jgi:hypothetical protein